MIFSRVYLIGYMGSGKSTIGKKLSRKLGFGFIDLDGYVEEHYGKSIPSIFEEEGEQRFRELEKKYLSEVSQLENVIISTGGGTPCFFGNMDMMNRSGVTIYLKMSVAALANRLENARTQRPLLTGLTREGLKDFIKEALQKREPFYNQAHYLISGENADVDELMALIS